MKRGGMAKALHRCQPRGYKDSEKLPLWGRKSYSALVDIAGNGIF